MYEKIPVSFRLIKTLKEDIEKLAKDAGISSNSAVNLLLDAIVEDVKSGKRKIISEVVKTSKD